MDTKTFEAKTYTITGLIRQGKSKHVDMPDAGDIPFVTLELTEEGNEDQFMGDNAFLVITARTKTQEAAVNKVLACVDKDTGKFDPTGLGNANKVKGLFKSWPASPHWQTERDPEGKVQVRKFREGHPDHGMRMPSKTVTMFIWKRDLDRWESIVASSIPAKAIIRGEEEEMQGYRYQGSNFANEVMKRAKAEIPTTKEGQDDEEPFQTPKPEGAKVP